MGYPFEHWIGVDFDGTLVQYHEWLGPDKFGPPIFPMIHRVRAWLAQSKSVRIVTARVASVQDPENLECAYEAIRQWCIKYLGQAIPIQAEKDPGMLELWDDSAIPVGHNTGAIESRVLYVGGSRILLKPNEVFCGLSEALPSILSQHFSRIVLDSEALCVKREILIAVRAGMLGRVDIDCYPRTVMDQIEFDQFKYALEKVWREQEAQYLKEVQS